MQLERWKKDWLDGCSSIHCVERERELASDHQWARYTQHAVEATKRAMKIYPEWSVIALASQSSLQNEYRGPDGHEDVIMIMKDAARTHWTTDWLIAPHAPMKRNNYPTKPNNTSLQPVRTSPLQDEVDSTPTGERESHVSLTLSVCPSVCWDDYSSSRRLTREMTVSAYWLCAVCLVIYDE